MEDIGKTMKGLKDKRLLEHVDNTIDVMRHAIEAQLFSNAILLGEAAMLSQLRPVFESLIKEIETLKRDCGVKDMKYDLLKTENELLRKALDSAREELKKLNREVEDLKKMAKKSRRGRKLKGETVGAENKA